MPSVLGKRTRTYSTAKHARPAKRIRTDRGSNTLNADKEKAKENECPDTKTVPILPIATQEDDTPKTPTKKPPPCEQQPLSDAFSFCSHASFALKQ